MTYALAVAVAAAAAVLARAFARRRRRVAQALIVSPPEHTRIDPQTGAVTSVQCADLVMPAEALDAIWSPMHLERLARTYWRFLTRVTLQTIQVKYREDGRDVKLFGLVPLLSFHAPEYEMDAQRGIVRWRIEKGVLVAAAGRGGRGYLEIDVQRRPYDKPGYAIAHVEVEVANFYPAIAFGVSRWAYENTQSRIHVLVTHGFLRSLARLDLDESRVGRFARIDELPDPVPAREREDLGEPVTR
ncbi:MAG TPA: hypothetical protein VGW75_05910 [Solirubrobacteraceae bacterium]|jgi:hypothetical protein|nr:hypothetical protein [Solirubrobacteraceae bacterium]